MRLVVAAAPVRARPPRRSGSCAARIVAHTAAAAAALLLPLALGCDGGLKPEIASMNCPTGICGTVRFRGAVPDSTEWVRVVVYASVPTNASQLTAYAGFSDVLPLGTASAFYSCCITALPPGPYRWVLVVWKKLGALDVTTAPDLLRELGAYQNPADTTQFGTVGVPGSGGVGGINMVADFGKMRSITDFFPPGAIARASRRTQFAHPTETVFAPPAPRPAPRPEPPRRRSR